MERVGRGVPTNLEVEMPSAERMLFGEGGGKGETHVCGSSAAADPTHTGVHQNGNRVDVWLLVGGGRVGFVRVRCAQHNSLDCKSLRQALKLR